MSGVLCLHTDMFLPVVEVGIALLRCSEMLGGSDSAPLPRTAAMLHVLNLRTGCPGKSHAIQQAVPHLLEAETKVMPHGFTRSWLHPELQTEKV